MVAGANGSALSTGVCLDLVDAALASSVSLALRAADLVVRPRSDGRGGLLVADRVELLRQGGEPTVLILPAPTIDRLRLALRSGARGVVHEQRATVDIVDAVRAISEGEMYVGRGCVGVLVDHVVRAAPGIELPRGVHLSPRQHDVLELLVAGVSTPAVAIELGTTPRTVKSHVSAILAALGVATRAEAVARVTGRQVTVRRRSAAGLDPGHGSGTVR